MRLRKCVAAFFTLFKFLTGYAHMCRNQRDRSAIAHVFVLECNTAYLQVILSRGKTLRQLIASESESLYVRVFVPKERSPAQSNRNKQTLCRCKQSHASV